MRFQFRPPLGSRSSGFGPAKETDSTSKLLGGIGRPIALHVKMIPNERNGLETNHFGIGSNEDEVLARLTARGVSGRG
jgi:hypothetical protein